MTITTGSKNGSAAAAKDPAFSGDLEQAVAEHRQTYEQICAELVQIDRGNGGGDRAADDSDSVSRPLHLAGHARIGERRLLISQLAQLMELSFSRIQFTPDLMPADITGGEVLGRGSNHGKASFSVSSKARSSVTSCWPTRSTERRRKVRVHCWRRWKSGNSRSRARPIALPDPFFRVSPPRIRSRWRARIRLPEAQLDRFLLKIHVDYPTRESELEICRRAAARNRHRASADARVDRRKN